MDFVGLEYLFSLGILGAGLAAGWKKAFYARPFFQAGKAIDKSFKYITTHNSIQEPLANKLVYRAFNGDYVETKGAELWAGIAYTPIPTDGIGDEDWDYVSPQINSLFFNIPDNTKIQAIHYIYNDLKEVNSIFEKQINKAAHPNIIPILKSRLRHFENKSAKGQVRDYRSYILFGRKARVLETSVPGYGLFSPNPFIDIEKSVYQKVCQEIDLIRRNFIAGYRSLGGNAWTISANEIREEIYRDLNPERSIIVPAPENTESSRNGGKEPQIRRRGRIALDDTHHRIFAENPRKSLSFTNIKQEKDYFLYGSIPAMTIILQRIPGGVYPGLLEGLWRNPDLNFPIKITTTFDIHSRYEWIQYFNKKQFWHLMGRTEKDQQNKKKVDANRVQESITNIQNELRDKPYKFGYLTFTITFFAETVGKLYECRDRLLQLIHSLESAEGCVDGIDPQPVHFSSLQCAALDDDRRIPTFSNYLTGLSAITGPFRGVGPEEATTAYQGSDGYPVYMANKPRAFTNGDKIILGPKGSGKTGFICRSIIDAISEGRRVLVFDFDGSYRRLCKAFGGLYIKVSDPRRKEGLGIFSIRPKADEAYEPEELTKEGLPIEALTTVEMTLEKLCRRRIDEELDAEEVKYLKSAITATYKRKERPIVGDFLRTIDNPEAKYKEIALRLHARLSNYAEGTSLGHILNDSSDPLPVDYPIICFDFASEVDANDPRAQMLSFIATRMYMSRWLHSRRDIGKAIFIDEFAIFSRDALIRSFMEEFYLVARRLNCVVAAATTDPQHFKGNREVETILNSADVKVLFPFANPRYVKDCVGLSDGEYQQFESLKHPSADSREFLMIYPSSALTRACSKITLDFDDLEARLCLGGGAEKASFDAAMKAFDGELPQSLIEAINSDAMTNYNRVQLDKQ